jgi:hypothetical protein
MSYERECVCVVCARIYAISDRDKVMTIETHKTLQKKRKGTIQIGNPNLRFMYIFFGFEKGQSLFSLDS